MLLERTKQALMTDWLDALRSGEYEQTTHFIRRDSGYCCMGVADEVCFGAQFHSVYTAPIRLGADMIYRDDLGHELGLPPSRAQALGLLEDTGIEDRDAAERLVGQAYPLPHGSRSSVLAWLNDRGATFNEIAEYIQDRGWDL